jgi:hypothetical protein
MEQLSKISELKDLYNFFFDFQQKLQNLKTVLHTNFCSLFQQSILDIPI